MAKFGSPNRGDPTSYWENIVEDVATWGVDFALKVSEHVANRPPGTTTVTQADQHTQWELMMLDPKTLQASLEARANVVGLENAAAEFLKWDAKHKKMGPAPEPLPPEPVMQMPQMPGPMPMNGAQDGSTTY